MLKSYPNSRYRTSGALSLSTMDGLNRDIEEVGRSRTVAELAAATQRALETIAYYISQSEGIVLDQQERWHGDYTDALYADAGVARAAAAAARRPPPPPPALPSGRGGARSDEKGGARSEERGRGADSGATHRRAVAATSGCRARAEDVPPSLRTIFDGTHPSFKQEDPYM